MNGIKIRIVGFIKRIVAVGRSWKVNLRVVGLTCLIMGITVTLLSAQQQEKKQSKKLLTLYNLSGMQNSANVEDLQQIITLDLKGANLEEALVTIADKAGLKLMYSEALLPKEAAITLSKQFITLNDALWEVLDGTGLRFALSQNHQLVLLKKQTDKLQVAQETITGQVTDAKTGETLPGVNILVKGTSTGASTDANGQYELTVESLQDTLVVSFVGYQTKQEPIRGRTEINIALQSQAITGEEMVVTALGLEQSKRSLTYSTQEVKTEQLTENRDVNLMNSLEGKVAGLSVNSSGNGIGSKARVLLRGNRSITGDSQPIYVIDGVPSLVNPGAIDPDNVASINVLKGANAAALYGSKAQNGAIIITTKKGKPGETKISLNNSFQFRQPDLNIRFQNTYGQGQGGIYNKNSEYSWGPKMDGQMVENWSHDPASAKYAFTPQPNNVRDIYQTGYNWSENIIASIGSKKNQTLISYTNTVGRGVLPNNDLDRHHISARETAELFDKKLSLDTKIDFTWQKVANNNTINRFNLNRLSALIPRSVRAKQLSDYQYTDESGQIRQNYFSPGSATGANPFWVMNRTPNKEVNTRILSLASLTYHFTNTLNLMARVSYDEGNSSFTQRLYNDNYATAPSGRFTVNENKDWLFDTDFLFSYNKDVNNDWNIQAKFGGELKKVQTNTSLSSNTGTALVVPNFFTISNTNLPVTSYNPGGKTETQSLYAIGKASWKDAIYLDLTGRNDWSSTLPSGSRSYFYPSAGLGVVFSNIIQLPKFFSFAKVRASYAQVGSSAPPYMINRSASFLQGGSNGFLRLSDTLPNKRLVPEKTKSYEIGLTARFFENRLGLTLTGYKTNTTNQLFTVQLPVGSGAARYFTNGGDVQNKGVEAQLTAEPVSSKNFQWNLSTNFSSNQNIVKKISDERPKVTINTTFVDEFVIQQGKPFGQIYSRGFIRDDKGRVIVRNDGMPEVTDGQSVPIGTFSPDWLGSISNTFTYKNFSMNFLISHRQGGVVLSGTSAILNTNGVSEETLNGRSGGLVFGDNLFAKETAVTENGKKNTTAISSEKFWKGVGGRNSPVGEAFVKDATSTRLRSLTVSYSLPRTLLEKIFITNLKFSLVGKNLFFIHRASKDLDPDFLRSASPSGEGSQYFSSPTVRTYGLNVNIDF